MLAKVAYDEHYGDIGAMMNDLAKLLRNNFQMLIEADVGTSRSTNRCSPFPRRKRSLLPSTPSIQQSMGLRIMRTFRYTSARATTPSARTMMAKSHRYFDTGRYKADLITKIECSSYLVEYDMAHHYEGLIGDKQIGIGAVTFRIRRLRKAPRLPRVLAQRWVAPEQTIVTSTCGFNHLPRHTDAVSSKPWSRRRLLGG